MHPFATKNIIYFCLNPSFIILFCCLIEDMNLEKCLSLAIIILQEDVEVAPEFNRVRDREQTLRRSILSGSHPESYSQITDSGHVIFQYRRSLGQNVSILSTLIGHASDSVFRKLGITVICYQKSPFTFIPNVLFIKRKIHLQRGSRYFTCTLRVVESKTAYTMQTGKKPQILYIFS